MGVVVTQHPAHHLGALDRRAGGEEAGDPHAVEDAPLDGLEAVAGVRQGAVGDHGEAVGGEGALQEGAELLQLDLARGLSASGAGALDIHFLHLPGVVAAPTAAPGDAREGG